MNILKQAWLHVHDHFLPSQRNNYKPHLVAHRSLSLYAALLISVKFVTFFSLAVLPENQAFSSAINARNILELTNYSRESYGVGQLQESNVLDQAAQAKAEDMLHNQYFAHVSPQGITPWDFIKAAGYNYLIAGENLAINFYSSEGVSQAWMDSPEHKANILNPDFQDIGIGVAEGDYHGVKAIWVVQMFGSSSDRMYVPKDGFTVLKDQPQQKPALSLPAAAKVALQKPYLNDPGFYLTNKKDLSFSGVALGASKVYILINGNPWNEFAVVNGDFSGNLQLAEGDNTIKAVAFNDAGQASPASDSVILKLDSSAPKILSAQISPDYSGQNLIYDISVQIQGSPVKVVASLGPENIRLQPTSDPSTWVGRMVAQAGQVQGEMNISAYNLVGNSSFSRVASLADSATNNYGFLAEHKISVNIFGYTFAMNVVNNVYIYFVIGLLLMLGVVIYSFGIKREHRNIGIIAHISGIIAMALIFWVI